MVAFEGVLTLIASLLVVTFLAFIRMNKDVRRARMLIMADRVQRFLGAFTLGFVVITVEFLLAIVGVQVPGVVASVVIFVFMGAMLFGSLELFFIVRPRRLRRPFTKRTSAADGGLSSREESLEEESSEGGPHAAR